MTTTKNLPPQAHAIAGAIGGAFATWLFYPLELLRVEMQRNNKKSSDSSQQDDVAEEETNLECFIRLYKQKTLYRGSSSMITTMLISSYITFYTLEVIRRRMSILQLQGRMHHNRIQKQQRQVENHIKFLHFILPKSNVALSLLASTITGIINVLITTPLWNGTRRIMEMDPSSSDEEYKDVVEEKKTPNLFQMMYKIGNDEGILQLWHGTLSSLLLVSNPAIQYFIYEQIRVWVLGIKNRSRIINSSSRSSAAGRKKDKVQLLLQLTAMEAFVFGALSKTVATVLTYPLQLGQMLIRIRKNEVQDMKQKQHDKVNEDSNNIKVAGADVMNLKEYNGMIDCLYQQYTNNGGFTSLFVGMSSKLVQTVGQASFIFVTYEQMLALVGKVSPA